MEKETSKEESSELIPTPTPENPYPRGISALGPIEFYEAETGLEILIINAKKKHGKISRKQFTEVLNELKKIGQDSRVPPNLRLALDQLIAQYHQAAKFDGDTVHVDINKMQAILDALVKT